MTWPIELTYLSPAPLTSLETFMVLFLVTKKKTSGRKIFEVFEYKKIKKQWILKWNKLYPGDKFLQNLSKIYIQRPGDCICKPGFGGRRCDVCAPGYRNHPKCEPCPCSQAGSLNFDTCEEERCICKPNVEGLYCDRCKVSFFTLMALELNQIGLIPDLKLFWFIHNLLNISRRLPLSKYHRSGKVIRVAVCGGETFWSFKRSNGKTKPQKFQAVGGGTIP